MDAAVRPQLRSYADAIAMWGRGFDTWSIARETGVPEPTVERWVWNFREQMRAP